MALRTTICQHLMDLIHEWLIDLTVSLEVKMNQVWKLLERFENNLSFGFPDEAGIFDCDVDSLDMMKDTQTFQCGHIVRETFDEGSESSLHKKESAEYVRCGVRTACLAREAEVDESLMVLPLVTLASVDHLTDIAEDLGGKVLELRRHLELRDCNLARSVG
jgi:hypothetical protein